MIRIQHVASPRMPSVAHVERALRGAHADLRRIGALTKGGWVDVRLQVYEDGQWALRTGLSDYDLDHRGFWASGSLPFPKSTQFRTMARALIAQCADAAAEHEAAHPNEEALGEE